MTTSTLTRRSLLPALAALAAGAGRARRGPGRPPVPAAARARIRAAAAEFEAAADALYETEQDTARARHGYQAGAISGPDFLAVMQDRLTPAVDRLRAADDGLTGLIRGAGLVGVVVAGELYLDTGQDDSGDGDCPKNVVSVEAGYVVDLDRP